MTLGDRLKALRFARRESLFQVAEAVGSSKAHIWDLERNRSKNPTIDLLRRIAAHFQVEVSYLIDNDTVDISAAHRFYEKNKTYIAKLGREDLMMIERLITRLSSGQFVITDGHVP